MVVVNDLPVGSIVRLGRYSLAHRSDDMFDIDWIKVSKQNDFISKKVLLGMQFDPMEGWNSNGNYSLSNIRQFMNSESLSWYHPSHPNDCGPGYITLDSYIRIGIHHYAGLLYHFMDEEVAQLEKIGSDYLRLPTVEEIEGGFPYFRRHGKRAHPVSVYGQLERDKYKESMFSRYYVTRNDGMSVAEVDRMGYICGISPAKYSGVRPVCKMRSATEVKSIESNTYECNLPANYTGRFFRETQPLDWLLGIK